MSQPDQEEFDISSESDSPVMAGEGSGHIPQDRNGSNNNKSWPSISAIMTLLGGSRTTQDNSEINRENEKIDEELSCPICQDIMKEVFATNCGHSFCYQCITQHIDRQPDCPLCRSNLTRAEIYPNFQLNKLAEHRIRTIKETAQLHQKDPVERIIKDSKGDHLKIAKTLATHLSYEDLAFIFRSAMEQRQNSEDNENKIKKDLLCSFLSKLKKKNKMTVDDLLLQNKYLSSDLMSMTNQEDQQLDTISRPRKRRLIAPDVDENEEEEEEEEDSLSASSSLLVERSSVSPLASRMDSRFEDLKDIYHSTLVQDKNSDKRRKLLHDFSSTMYELTRYDSYEVLDTLNYTDATVSSSIVSSIEFDRDEEFFAVGGVTREIKIFDFSMMGLERYNAGMIHCPLRVMNCGHKISCLSWSPYIKSQIASSDYEGFIDIWDANTGQKTARFEEHKRRAWSVDICHQNPNILASGSDDTTVKVWSLSLNKSIHTLELKGNVCCAKFAPNNSHYLAVGSADHNVSCYDLRYPNNPIKVYEGHKKAVSYVKWLNDDEIVSASTDSTLKLWDRESTECKRTFTGHQNEKNFVGLSINGDWISCGSESNTLYTYHKSSTVPVTKFKFPPYAEATDDDDATEENTPLFVSSVCWKKGANHILAANSKGIIKVLQMK